MRASLEIERCLFERNTSENASVIQTFTVRGVRSEIDIRKSTFTGNSGYAIALSDSAEEMIANLELLTIVGNSGGISAPRFYKEGDRVVIKNCIVTRNSSPDSGIFSDLDIRSTAIPPKQVLEGVNLISSNANSPFAAVPGFIGTTDDPVAVRLAPLGDYGGLTGSMPPLSGSPAINNAGNTDPAGLDQRGLPRFVEGALDIGATEF